MANNTNKFLLSTVHLHRKLIDRPAIIVRGIFKGNEGKILEYDYITGKVWLQSMFDDLYIVHRKEIRLL